ncbi:MAG: cytochrome c nitrite reductase small subunit [Armatimonadota bacterium]
MYYWLTTVVRNILAFAFLPAAWRLPCFAMLGVAAGLALVLVRVSEFPSYLSDSPRTCINCHIMAPEYATWQRSAHASVSVCNDCHVPHDSILSKYAFKAKDGMRHATIFAMRGEPQVIQAIPASRTVIEQNCLRCHETRMSGAFLLQRSERSCADCHRATPHGEVHGLSSTPHVRIPSLPPVTSSPFGGATP